MATYFCLTLLICNFISSLYASPKQIAKGETVSLAGIYPYLHSIYILVDTTAPLARVSTRSAIMAREEENNKTTELVEDDEENEPERRHAVRSDQNKRGNTEDRKYLEKEKASSESAEVDSLGPVSISAFTI